MSTLGIVLPPGQWHHSLLLPPVWTIFDGLLTTGSPFTLTSSRRQTNGQDDTAWRQRADSLSRLAAHRGLQALSGIPLDTTVTWAAAC